HQIRDGQPQKSALHAANLPAVAGIPQSAGQFPQLPRRIRPQTRHNPVEEQHQRHNGKHPAPKQSPCGQTHGSRAHKWYDQDIRDEHHRQKQQRQRTPSRNLENTDALPPLHRVAQNLPRLLRREMMKRSKQRAKSGQPGGYSRRIHSFVAVVQFPPITPHSRSRTGIRILVAQLHANVQPFSIEHPRQPRPRAARPGAQVQHAVGARVLNRFAQLRHDIGIRPADIQQDLQIVGYCIAQKGRKPRLVVYLKKLHPTHNFRAAPPAVITSESDAGSSAGRSEDSLICFFSYLLLYSLPSTRAALARVPMTPRFLRVLGCQHRGRQEFTKPQNTATVAAPPIARRPGSPAGSARPGGAIGCSRISSSSAAATARRNTARILLSAAPRDFREDNADAARRDASCRTSPSPVQKFRTLYRVRSTSASADAASRW